MNRAVILPLFFLFFFFNLSYGQYISSATDLDPDCDTLSLRIIASFPFGSPGNCPSLVSNTLSVNNSTITIGLTYDASGPWPAFFCSNVDTVDFILPPGATFVLIKAYAIYDATVTASNSVTLATCATTGLEQRDKPDRVLLISPNPAKHHINLRTGGTDHIDAIRIFDLTGAVVLSNSENRRELDISSLKAGLYFIEATINGSRSIQKFIRED